MISKATAKFIKSLQLKKFRKQHQLFVVEGTKSVREVLNSSFSIHSLVGTDQFLAEQEIDFAGEVHRASPSVLTSIGSFKSNDSALAVVEIPEEREFKMEKEFVIVLDGVNDPGNLGTILRIADWYGVNKVVASHDTAELYNPKVIAASKGSFCRVNTYYTDLANVLTPENAPIYITAMEGDNIHDTSFADSGFVVMGNEAHGVSESIQKVANHKITIPRFGHAESLNVAVATAIICDNVFRNA